MRKAPGLAPICGFVLLAALLSALSGCGAATAAQGAKRVEAGMGGTADTGVSVVLSSEPELETLFSSLLAQRPLPSGYSLSEKAGGGEKLSLSWGRAGEAASANSPSPGSAVLGRRWLAVPVDLLDPRVSASGSEAEAMASRELSKLGLPERALEVDGLWPGQKGYPLEEELLLGYEGREGALKDWVASVGADFESGKIKLDGVSQERPLILAAVGDIVPGEAETHFLSEGEAGLQALFGKSLPELRMADILVGNLEGVVSERGEGNPRKRFQFRFPPSTPKALMSAGFDLVLLGNNHVFDFGEEGFSDSLDGLSAAGLPEVGAGRNEGEALLCRAASGAAAGDASDAMRDTGLVFIGFGSFPKENYGFTTAEAAAGESKPGINADEEATVRAIAEATKSGKRVVVLAHGGNEYRAEPSSAVKARYRRFIDAGAAAVLGSHPHILQGFEAYKGGLIAYSLGNFLFTADVEPPESRPSGILELLVYRGRVAGLRLVPVIAGEHGTEMDSQPEAAWERIRGLSEKLR
jgi:poly-gamma-glutamate capsule biosynthesis protein CapA/YwtB (metallophosphatase superfamily)